MVRLMALAWKRTMSTWSAAAVVLVSLLRAAAQEPAAAVIEGPVWRLISLRGQEEKALAGLPAGITIRFEAGTAQGFGGCNQLVGSYTVEGDLVTVAPLAATMMACSQEVM